jgi:uncharacterized protein YodC (DUF2158 family)
MSFKSGDAVVHRSDKRPRKMVVVEQAFKKSPPLNIHNELANIGHAPDGSYFCTWIVGTKKGTGYFEEVELELQK